MRKRSIVAYTLLAVGLTALNACGPMEWMKVDRDKGYVVFNYSTLKNLPPSHVPTPGDVAKQVSCTLAGDEYEPVQIGVHALADGLTNIRVTVVSDLEVAVYHRIDPGIKQQVASEPGATVLMRVPSEVYLQRGEVVGELAKGESINFWLLFRADAETSPGVHQGKIRIKPDGRAATELDLAVRVRPFQLAEPRAVFAVYFREDMLPKRFGSWELEDQVALAFYRDMAAHGQNSVTFYGGGDYRTELPPLNSRMVEKSLALAKKAGLTRPRIPVVTVASMVGDDISRTQQKAAVAWLGKEGRRLGWPEIVLFGRDEGMYPALRFRKIFTPLRPLPIRVSADMSHISPAYAYGDFLDVWTVHDGLLTPELQAEAKRMGAEVWSYSYRIWRQSFSPITQRYYVGLHTWAHRIEGNWLWAYSHGPHSQVWWKPDSHEPMPHTGWEGRREGVDDYRYLQMVEDLVEAKTPDPTAIEAGAWVEALRARLTLKSILPHQVEAGTPLTIEEYDAIRATAADYIEKLGPIVDRKERRTGRGLKDEAAAFRGKSVKRCIAGLRGSDVSKRRAAAWALYELGPQAAKATPALISLLDDPEVRFPALHALEAIGPDAYPAATKIASLLSHPDAVVRQGATFALAGIARPRNWDEDFNGYALEDVSPYAHVVVPALRQALRDSHQDIVWIAGYGLSRCGEAAAPALSDAMKLVAGKPHDNVGAATRALAGMGPAAAAAVPLLVEHYTAAKAKDRYVTLALAAIGPAASDAVAVLERYRTPQNSHLADTCYALFCIRGEESDLKTMVGLLGDKENCGAWEDVVRYLIALGAKAAPVAPLVRDRLSLLKARPDLVSQLELTFFRRVEEGGSPLRLLPYN